MDKKLIAKLVESMQEMNDIDAGKRKPSRMFEVHSRCGRNRRGRALFCRVRRP